MKLKVPRKHTQADRRPRKSKAGKGDGSRVSDVKKYRDNYGKIDWSTPLQKKWKHIAKGLTIKDK